MRIEPRQFRSARRHLKRDLRRAVSSGPLSEPICSKRCRAYDPSVGCNFFCPAAPTALSTDPTSPIETRIVPLVFELKRAGVFHPCWSCEGHDDPAGRLQKIPRVWFYANSVVHLRALGKVVDRLVTEKSLSARWQIVLTYSDLANPDTTFSLEPANENGDLDLGHLHNDIVVIAQSLKQNFRSACDRLWRAQA
jgi:hypothetical protein